MTATEPRVGADLDGHRPAIGAWAYFEGRIVPIESAQVGLPTHALNYGTAVFEGIRAYRQEAGDLALLFGPEHYDRLLRNARRSQSLNRNRWRSWKRSRKPSRSRT